MGQCVSFDAAAVAAADLADSVSTSKVIFPDGRLQEHCGGVSVRASRALLHKDLSPPSAFFLCCADDLDTEGRIIALTDNDDLEAGQIYFVLPAQMLKRRLHSEEMAKMAVMAARAITEAGGVIAKGNPYNGFEGEKKKSMRRAPATAARRRSRRGKDFASDLNAIPE